MAVTSNPTCPDSLPQIYCSESGPGLTLPSCARGCDLTTAERSTHPGPSQKHRTDTKPHCGLFHALKEWKRDAQLTPDFEVALEGRWRVGHLGLGGWCGRIGRIASRRDGIAPAVHDVICLREPSPEQALLVCVEFLLGHVIPPSRSLGARQRGCALERVPVLLQDSGIGGDRSAEGQGGREDAGVFEEGSRKLDERGLKPARRAGSANRLLCAFASTAGVVGVGRELSVAALLSALAQDLVPLFLWGKRNATRHG